ncbi:MAG TPA: YihY/virulence factor BrkB family protein [Candidatus Binatia bacterium]
MRGLNRTNVVWNFFRTTVEQWLEEGPFQLAAALAYYTLFSLAPLLIIFTGIVGMFAGETKAEAYIFGAVADLVGEQSAKAVQEMMLNAHRNGGGLFATLVGVALMLFGAGGVVGQLQSSLNAIWGVKTQTRRGLWPIIRARFLSYAMLLAIGFLLLVSLIVTTVLSAVSEYFSHLLPAAASLWPFLDVAISFGFVTVLFALIYKVLPDAHIAWKDVWVGAALTAFFFSVGKVVIGYYLGKSAVAASYGAAGSLVTVLLWVYYSALIFFFGAEVTRVYATQFGGGLQPTQIAETTKDGREKEREIEKSAAPAAQR